jgi:N-methylhydantoinase A
MVDEAMANAARVHAAESGKSCEGRALIAFGGGGPVHATRIAEKVGITRVLVPPGAGVGSAIGFLRAPVAYEVVRSLYGRLSHFDAEAVGALLDAMAREAAGIVAAASLGAETRETRTAYMRYAGQGHEIAVTLPAGPLGPASVERIRAAYDEEYARAYARLVPRSDVEVMSYDPAPAEAPASQEATPARTQAVRDTATGAVAEWPVHERAALPPGARFRGPAIVAEAETSTLLGPGWTGRIALDGTVELTREAA